MSKPYQPSCGTEGMDFMDAFCFRCKRDAAYQAWDRNGNKGPRPDTCPILDATFLYRVTDPEYPKEWITDEAGPRCTAYEAEKP